MMIDSYKSDHEKMNENAIILIQQKPPVIRTKDNNSFCDLWAKNYKCAYWIWFTNLRKR